MAGLNEPGGRGLEAVATGGSSVEFQEARRKREREQAAEALSLRLAGLTQAQIAARLGIAVNAVQETLSRELDKGRPSDEQIRQMRELENARLDRVQAAIWSKVLEGDLKAVDSYLRISQRRARMNGFDAPIDVTLSITVRQEMEQALAELESVVLGNKVIMGEVLNDVREA